MEKIALKSLPRYDVVELSFMALQTNQRSNFTNHALLAGNDDL